MDEFKYVVRGAHVKCTMGKNVTRLNLPKSHGAYINERPVLIATDTAAGVNVMPFGKCKKRKKCSPSLSSCWRNTQEDMKIKGQPALVTKSVLSCAVGGTIEIKTDGQHD